MPAAWPTGCSPGVVDSSSLPVRGSAEYDGGNRPSFSAGTWKPVSFIPSGAKTRSLQERSNGWPAARAMSTPSTSEPVW